MKLKVKLKKSSSLWENDYYIICKKVFLFFWVEISGLYSTKEEACSVAVRILEQESKELKNKKEPPVYFELHNDRVIRSEE
jgi:hypothetical protein